MSKPRIRFRGFDGHWGRNKLKDYLTIREDIAEDKFTKENVLSVSGDYGVVNQIAFQGRSYAGQSITNYRVVNKGNVLYTKSPLKANPYGIVKTAKSEEGIVSPLYAVYDTNDNCDPDFVQTYFDDADRLNQYLRPLVNKGAKNTLLISDEGALQGEVIFPIKDEQEKIGGYFDEIDSLLHNAQNKISRLNSLKICYLTRLFPIGGGTEPPMRMQGFTGEWEVRKLRDITSRIVRKNINLQSNRSLTISAQYGLIEQESFFNSRIASSNLSNYYLLKKGEFAYNKSTSQGYPYGAVKRLDKYDDGVLSTLYIVFEIDPNKVDSDYLAAYFDTALWHEEIRLRAAEGARNHGLLNISADDFFDIDIKLPKSLDEQRILGKYFVDMNNLINLHSQELEHLKALKASCLDGMFVNP